ncbi:MAG: hypothetical protein IJT56_04905 [Clostridia bacterium]|nr:hypothetical protein [Clostridia bacterium]
MKKLEMMTQQELTLELVKGQKKQTKIRVISVVLNVLILAALAAGLLYAVPTAVETMTQVQSVLDEVDDLSVQARESMVKADKLMDDADKLLNDNSGSIADIMVKLNGIDFDKLNQSIQRLSEILIPISKLFGGGIG